MRASICKDSASLPRVKMADHAACFETPAPPSSFVGAGKVEKLGDLDTYIVGSETATSAVLLITDIYGESASGVDVSISVAPDSADNAESRRNGRFILVIAYNAQSAIAGFISPSAQKCVRNIEIIYSTNRIL